MLSAREAQPPCDDATIVSVEVKSLHEKLRDVSAKVVRIILSGLTVIAAEAP